MRRWSKAFSNSFPVDRVSFEDYKGQLLLNVRLGKPGVRGSVWGVAITDQERQSLIRALLTAEPKPEPTLWDQFRAIYGPRPGGRGAQLVWEAAWRQFHKEHS